MNSDRSPATSDLLPCPFCGSEPLLEVGHNAIEPYFCLGCNDANCAGHRVYDAWSIEFKDASIAKWNRRTASETRRTDPPGAAGYEGGTGASCDRVGPNPEWCAPSAVAGMTIQSVIEWASSWVQEKDQARFAAALKQEIERLSAPSSERVMMPEKITDAMIRALSVGIDLYVRGPAPAPDMVTLHERYQRVWDMMLKAAPQPISPPGGNGGSLVSARGEKDGA